MATAPIDCPKEGETNTVNVILVGMAGSGKTTLVSKLAETVPNGYFINLDPACMDPPYSPNIDIRDTVNYKEVMKEYGLGPNGAIVTSLNLYSTKIDQLISVIQSKDTLTILDTPGQIEVFTWSASGSVITEALATIAPTVYLYVVDTARCVENPNTFMANMTYACSIMYKTRLPLIIVFTKTDVTSCETLNQWMDDYQTFLDALDTHESYSNELQRSLCYALDEFYNMITHCGVSSKTGDGIPKLLELINSAKKQYYEEYYQQKMKVKERLEKEKENKKKKDLERFKQDRKEERENVDSEYCGAAGVRMFGEEDEGIVFRGGQRFFFGKSLGSDQPDVDAEGKEVQKADD